MTISSVLPSVILLQVISKTVSQFPMPFPLPGGGPPMGMPPLPPIIPPGLTGTGGSMNFPLQQKMPMVVMPYYSRSIDKKFRKKKNKRRIRRIRYDSSSSSSYEDDSSSSSDFDFRRSKRRHVLTPVVSYVTKDGYVVYQKKIKKDKAKDWLEMKKGTGESEEIDDGYENEKILRKLKKLKFARRHHKKHH